MKTYSPVLPSVFLAWQNVSRGIASVLSQEVRNHEARNREVFRGQLFGFLIGSIAIVSGSVIAAMGSQWSGGFIGGGGVIGLVAVFILGQHKHRADGNSGKGQSGA